MGAPIDDELVLLHVDKGRYYSLKSPGPDLWAQLETPHSLEELVNWVCERYEVTKEVALTDIKKFLLELQNIDAIEVIETA
jgi:hypothetical protein